MYTYFPVYRPGAANVVAPSGDVMYIIHCSNINIHIPSSVPSGGHKYGSTLRSAVYSLQSDKITN